MGFIYRRKQLSHLVGGSQGRSETQEKSLSSRF